MAEQDWRDLNPKDWGGDTMDNAQVTCGAEVDIGYFVTLLEDDVVIALSPRGRLFRQRDGIWKEHIDTKLTLTELYDLLITEAIT